MASPIRKGESSNGRTIAPSLKSKPAPLTLLKLSKIYPEPVGSPFPVRKSSSYNVYLL